MKLKSIQIYRRTDIRESKSIKWLVRSWASDSYKHDMAPETNNQSIVVGFPNNDRFCGVNDVTSVSASQSIDQQTSSRWHYHQQKLLDDFPQLRQQQCSRYSLYEQSRLGSREICHSVLPPRDTPQTDAFSPRIFRSHHHNTTPITFNRTRLDNRRCAIAWIVRSIQLLGVIFIHYTFTGLVTVSVCLVLLRFLVMS